MKKQEKIKLFYDAGAHVGEMTRAYEGVLIFNNLVKELESIIKKPIEDYNAFKKDAYSYSIEAIKKTFPKPFDLGLDIEATLKMLTIDLSTIHKNSDFLKTFPYNFVIDKNGKAKESDDEEPYTYYAETTEHFERLAFSNEIITIAEKAYSLNPNLSKFNYVAGFTQFAVCDPQYGFIPNWRFVLYGI
jgi:hypothetical protein